MTRYRFDDEDVVVIVGSGAGGGTLANELCQRGVRVVLLEAGPRLTHDDFVNDEWQAFTRVVFPALKPINVVIGVITVIESLRAFDIVYVINKGTNGLELLSVLVTNNIIGEASRIGFGSTLAVILLVVSLAFIIPYLVVYFRGSFSRELR